MNKYENLTDNFKYYEFFSGDKKLGKNSIEPPEQYFDDILQMAKELQIVRNYIGSPIIITSGWRTPKWNKYCGGVINSYHIQGLAVDIRVNDMQPCDLAIYMAKITMFAGFGINIKKNFVHCDARPRFMVFKY